MVRKRAGVSRNTLFVGGGFSDDQYLWLLPVLDGYCRSKGIEEIRFESAFSNKLLEIPHVSKILSTYRTVVPAGGEPFRNFTVRARLLMGCFRAIPLAIQSKRERLLEECSWYETQMRHAVFDNALQSSPDGKVRLSFYARFLSALSVLESARRARTLVSQGVNIVFLGHTVYTVRAMLAEFSRVGATVYAHNAFVLHKMPSEKDTSWSQPSRQEWVRLLALAPPSEIGQFWQERSRGQSSYEDAELAARASARVTDRTPKNVVLCHIFRDSPFNYLDRGRAFEDYVAWIHHTLQVISASNEEWLIKLHPNAQRWGENQHRWLRTIAKSAFGTDGWPKNIEIAQNNYSNVALFAQSHRIVTFSGLAHLEAACWGIKPIVITDVMLSSFSPELVLKPESREEYTDLLLRPGNSYLFRLTESEKLIAQQLLYIRENVLSFRAQVGSAFLQRNDATHLVRRNFADTLWSTVSCLDKLESTGRALAGGTNRSVALMHQDEWQNLSLSGSDPDS